MSVRKLVEIGCDYRACEGKILHEGTQVKAWEAAEAAGFIRRGIWTLCKNHAEVPVIHR